MSPNEKTDYEKIRQDLVERGYLDGRVGRFVLSEAASGRSWISSVFKAVLLGTPLLAALLATVVASRSAAPGAMGDWPLLWLYMTPIAAIALALINLAAPDLLWRKVPGRTDHVPRRGLPVTHLRSTNAQIDQPHHALCRDHDVPRG